MLRPSPNHGTQRLPNDDDEWTPLRSSQSMDWTGHSRQDTGKDDGKTNTFTHQFRSSCSIRALCWSSWPAAVKTGL